MTKKEAQQILDLITTFCLENQGNVMNQWLKDSLIRATQNSLNQILERLEKEKLEQKEKTTDPLIKGDVRHEKKPVNNSTKVPSPQLPPTPPPKEIINEDKNKK